MEQETSIFFNPDDNNLLKRLCCMFINSPCVANFPAPWKVYFKQKENFTVIFIVYIPIITNFIIFSRLAFIATGKKVIQFTLPCIS